MRQWIRRLRRRAPRRFDKTTWKLADTNAKERYQGDGADEPHIRRMLQDLGGELVRLFRNDAGLRAAQAAFTAAEKAVAVAIERRNVVTARTAAAIQNGEAVGTAVDVRSMALRADARRARDERVAAERAVTEARERLSATEDALPAAEAAVVDRLVVAATRGVEPVNEYIECFNLAREYDGRPGITPLPGGIVEELVRGAIRPLLVTRSR